MGYPNNWMIYTFILELPSLEWMVTRGNPHDLGTPQLKIISTVLWMAAKSCITLDG